MDILIMILRLAATAAIAFFVGKLFTKIKMPAILGWLITGMLLGPHAFSLLDNATLSASWYSPINRLCECMAGLMIGTELVWSKMKKTGRQIIITTLTQSLGTFLVVSLVFGVVFYFTNTPLYLALIFGGIALATAPAPALSIVREFKTDGPVTRTLVPMAALDDMVGVIVFFSVISVVSANLSAEKLPLYMIAAVLVVPLVIGAATGFLAGKLLKCDLKRGATLAVLLGGILLTCSIGFAFSAFVAPKLMLNFMLMGMAFATVFANMIPEERLNKIMSAANPIVGAALLFVILNLGAPLDYHLILGAGAFTAIYILARAVGKYGGAYFGAWATHSPDTVKKFLGLTLLPHSGVSLVFTGIAVSVLAQPAPDCARIIQGTIAAAAIINEVIAVIISQKAFKWAGELGKRVD